MRANSPVLSSSAVRRAALAAQGFCDPGLSGPVTRRHIARVVNRTQLLQLDSVNVAVRAHYMPLFTRLGNYPHDLIDDAAWTHSPRQPRLLAEYWAHEASLLPINDWPLLRWRMRRFERRFTDDPHSVIRRSPELVEKVLSAVAELGPISAGQIERALDLDSRPSTRPRGGWWNRSDVKKACEFLFALGHLTTGCRQAFQRFYDVSERVIPQNILSQEIDEADALVALMTKAAMALGIATEADLRDYYRIPPSLARPALTALVSTGILEPVRVRGWQHPAYRYIKSRLPRQVSARALLCPFDPLIWSRERTLRLFDFRYRIEIYVPGPQRIHGYYVFPFLLDDQIVARVDLKADRATGVLRIRGAFAEPSADTGRVAVELVHALWDMAEWLNLRDVQADDKGDLASALRSAL